MLEQYLKDLHKAASHGDAREETYYPVLKSFLELLAQKQTGWSTFPNKVTFTPYPEEVWNYHIGGYQVLHKYLKDRKGRNMDDPVHYCRIATAISKTIELQKEIDELYEGVEENIVIKENEVGD
jgi:hypothetical protein